MTTFLRQAKSNKTQLFGPWSTQQAIFNSCNYIEFSVLHILAILAPKSLKSTIRCQTFLGICKYCKPTVFVSLVPHPRTIPMTIYVPLLVLLTPSYIWKAQPNRQTEDHNQGCRKLGTEGAERGGRWRNLSLDILKKYILASKRDNIFLFICPFPSQILGASNGSTNRYSGYTVQQQYPLIAVHTVCCRYVPMALSAICARILERTQNRLSFVFLQIQFGN